MVTKGYIVGNVIFYGLGTLFLLVGAIVGGLWINIFNSILNPQLVLNNSSRSFKLWKETPLPMYLDIYMFNWTNPEEALKGGVKPSFKELGPYVFSEHHSKVNLVWNKNGTITYQQVRTWHFVPELSNGSLSDKITNINVIAMTIGNKIAKLGQSVPDLVLKLINDVIKIEENHIYVTKPVKELLFDGYDDKLLQLVKKLHSILKIDIPLDKFGWFYNRNNSADYDGVFNMDTGSNKISKLGSLYAWNYSSKTKFFNGSCSEIKGFTGELWPPHTSGDKYVGVFANDICSTANLRRSDPLSILGLEGQMFVGDELTFDNGKSLQENSCYCLKKPCQPSGARDMSTCKFGAPAFVSFPHFYLADPIYQQNISGMVPSGEKHRFTLVLEKETGIPLSVDARLQISIFVEPIKRVKFYENLPTAYLPQMWFNQRVSITKDFSSQIHVLELMNRLAQPILFSICAIGFLLILCGVYLCYRHHRTEKKDDGLLNENSEYNST